MFAEMGCGKSKHDEVATKDTITKTKSPKSKHDRSSFQQHEGKIKGVDSEEVRKQEAVTNAGIVANAESKGLRDEKKRESNQQEWNGISGDDHITVEAIISDGISGRTEYFSPNNKVGGGDGERLSNGVEENEQ